MLSAFHGEEVRGTARPPHIDSKPSLRFDAERHERLDCLVCLHDGIEAMLAIQQMSLSGHDNSLSVEPPSIIEDIVGNSVDVLDIGGAVAGIGFQQSLCDIWRDCDDLGVRLRPAVFDTLSKPRQVSVFQIRRLLGRGED